MRNQPIKVLLVEDDQDDYVILLDYFFRMKEGQYELDWICSYETARAEVAKHGHDIYLFDYRLGPENGVDLLREARAQGCTAPVILLTRFADPRLEALALEAGAAGFLSKNRTSAASLEQALLTALQPPAQPQAKS